MSEFVAPPLEKYARQLKVFSKFSEFSFAGNRGTWVRDGDTIISVEQQSAASRFGGVQVFRFDASAGWSAVAPRRVGERRPREHAGASRTTPRRASRRTARRSGRAPVEEIRTSICRRTSSGSRSSSRRPWACATCVAYIDAPARNDLDSTPLRGGLLVAHRAHRGAAAGGDPRAAVRARPDAQHRARARARSSAS